MAAALRADPAWVRGFRARRGGLGRVRAKGFAGAAWGGLQDTAPRSALLSLHARVEGVGPDSWADPDLAQVWGPRLAVYLVPAADAEVFTVGRSPRHDDRRRRLDRMAAAVLAAIGDAGVDGGQGRQVSEVFAAVGDRPGHQVRAASATGRYLLRWNASSNLVQPAPPPKWDAEAARRELARRYLGWLGPGTRDSFAAWAGVEPSDATETWRAILPETMEIDVNGQRRRLLSADLEAVGDLDDLVEVGDEIRLLPPNDPYLRPDKRFLVADGARYDALYRAKGAAAGALCAAGRIVGIWRRRQHHVSLHPWQRLDDSVMADFTAAARELRGPLGREIDLAPLD